MHFKDDPVSDKHAKYYLIIWCLKPFSGPSKFGPVFSGAVPSNTTTPTRGESIKTGSNGRESGPKEGSKFGQSIGINLD